ncbi:trypsin-1-like isoform X1 [Lucilia cuprina]|uniref:trypsin-1-like isoform X1 n=2 Tax=Lucilia cuprina TaxID=7375 RepID=UPI001F060EC1|nr:trypsin-1-like isoform X1 [Lucilia cuprina]
MKIAKQFNIFIILIVCSASLSNTHYLEKSEARQNNFIEWLISIFQFNPITQVTTIKPPLTETKQCMPCSCGTANVINRIVGGEETQEIRYPWMALLKNNNRFYCGGSLVSDRYVATAAHCLRGFRPNAISVSLLVHDRKSNSSREITRKAKRVIIHERYNPFNIDNDIGLIQLSESVEMSKVLRPVCMPLKDQTYLDELGIASGWGATSEGGPLAQKLMQVSVPIISNEECNEKYGEDRITENMMCAGVPEGNKDSCQGDSGGPFLVHNKDLNIYHLAGIVSWGEGCARPDRPGVYTRVTRYLDWIEKRTNDSCRCDMPSTKVLENIYWEREDYKKC